MRWLGIDTSSSLIYEGGNMFGAVAVWPSPVVTPTCFGISSDVKLKAARLESWGVAKFLFREDSFDPVTRIRRGRFFTRHGGQPNSEWRVIIAPPLFYHQGEIEGSDSRVAKKSAYTFQSYRVSLEVAKAEGKQVLVMLGAEEASTPWAIVNIETIHTGEELVTLKARQSMGVLPEVNWDKIPDEGCAKVHEELDRLENEFRKAGPESVVDRAREAATAILRAWIWSNVSEEDRAKKKLNDLGPLIEFWKGRHGINHGRGVACAAASIAYAAEIPQRFHSRGKHMEKERLNLRPLQEQDAELAVLCIGTILCDLGWAEWR